MGCLAERFNLAGRTILHCIPTFGGGGAERQLVYLADQMSARGVRVHIAHVSGGPNLARLQVPGSTLTRLQVRNNHDPAIFLQLVRLIQKVRPVVIQTWIAQMDVMGGLAALVTRTPYIVSERASAPAYSGGWKNRLRLLIGRRAAAVVANSVAGTRYWENAGYRGMTRVIRNGIPFTDIDVVLPARLDAWGGIPGGQVVVYAGRYEEQKNVVLMVDALIKVLRQRERATAFLFGEGPLREVLVRRVQAAGLEGRIRIDGYCETLWSMMKAADVFVSASSFEGNPNTVLEAAVCGCPLVISDIPEHREIFDDTQCFFVPTLSADGIANAIESCLTERFVSTDKADAARSRVAEFDMATAAQQYLEVYQQVLAQRNANLTLA